MNLKLLRNFYLFLFLSMIQCASSQEFFVNVGKNFSSYKMSSVNLTNNLIAPENHILSDGNMYEIGVLFNKNVDESKIAYQLGLNYNEYNLMYAYNTTSVKYSWQTKYIGIGSALVFTLFKPYRGVFTGVYANAKFGINISHYIDGYMNANGVNYDVSEHNDFNKNIIQPQIGCSIGYPISELSNLVFGYNWSVATVARDVSVINNFNNQFFIGLNVSLE